MQSYQHHARVRVLPHIEKLDDCFGDFIVAGHLPVRGVARHRAGSARPAGGQEGDAGGAGDPDALLTVRQEGRRGGRGGEAETARAWAWAENFAMTSETRNGGTLRSAIHALGRNGKTLATRWLCAFLDAIGCLKTDTFL